MPTLGKLEFAESMETLERQAQSSMVSSSERRIPDIAELLQGKFVFPFGNPYSAKPPFPNALHSLRKATRGPPRLRPKAPWAEQRVSQMRVGIREDVSAIPLAG
jgi:hypothetical protein